LRKQLHIGFTGVCFRLDRLGRSLVHLVKVLEDLETRGIGFETLDGVSTRGATGKLVLHILGSAAQFERQLIERTMAGLKAARAEGRTGGNRRRMTPQQIETARKRMSEGLKAREIATMYGVSERSLWRNLRWAADLEEVRGGS
jgi:DNA invertase Pin-like site-specific DNA recombinase